MPGRGWPAAGSTGPATGAAGLPLHPMSLSDVMDASFAVLRAEFRSIASILGAVVVPIHFVSALATRSALQGGGGWAFWHTTTTTDRQGVRVTSVHASSSSLLAVALAWVVLPWCAGAVSRVVAGGYLGHEVAAGPALKATAGRLVPLLVATIVVHVMEIVGGVLLILPGLLVMALSVAVAPSIAIDHLGPLGGIRRSWGLIRRRVWGVLGIALLTGAVFAICGSLISVPLTVAGRVVGAHWGWLLVFAAGVLSSVFTVALNAIAATLIYFDGRMRNEGFDLEVLASRLGP